MRNHLNHKQMSDLLMGCASSMTLEHLEHCERCRQELEELETGVRDLQAAAVTWSVEKNRTMPVPAERGWMPRRYLIPVAAALAIAALVPGGIYLSHRMRPETGQVTQAVVSPDSSREQQIASDNELLKAVNQELTEEVAPAMQPLLVKNVKKSGQTISE